LREAEEEIGLDPAAVELVGALPPTATFATGFRIHPFVGLVPDPKELALEFRTRTTLRDELALVLSNLGDLMTLKYEWGPAVDAFREIGLAFPPYSWDNTWTYIAGLAKGAVDVIREEVHAGLSQR
jgi:8-oxo-dGTP pyrophosphatase MutT (NUDIX family)